MSSDRYQNVTSESEDPMFLRTSETMIQFSTSQVRDTTVELERAIRSGNADSAVAMAKKLASARVAINAQTESELLQRENEINIKIYIEDKDMSGPMVTWKLAPLTTVKSLKLRMYETHGFLPDVQKWIIGKRIAKDSEMLADCGVKYDGSIIFLYLLTPLSTSETTGVTTLHGMPDSKKILNAAHEAPAETNYPRNPAGDALNIVPTLPRTVTPVQPALATAIQTAAGNMPPLATLLPSSQPGATFALAPLPVVTLRPTVQPDVITRTPLPVATPRPPVWSAATTAALHAATAHFPVPPQALTTSHSNEETSIDQVGWSCPLCTFVNEPTRPGCEQCATDRPKDYHPPLGYQPSEQERRRIARELQLDIKTIQAGLLTDFDETTANGGARRDADERMAAIAQLSELYDFMHTVDHEGQDDTTTKHN